MARLTPVDPRVMDRALSKLGFARVRQKGSHVLYPHLHQLKACHIPSAPAVTGC